MSPKIRSMLAFIFLLAGCYPVPVQYPPSSQTASLPQSVTQPQSQVTGSQRGQYIWQKMLEGVAMGGYIAGPYGAGGGLIIGLLMGLLTTDAHYAQLNAQIQTEQAKDRALEAQIEEEMERQRNLEAQLENSAGNPAQQKQSKTPQPTQKPSQTTPKEITVVNKEAPSALASLGKKERDENGSGHVSFREIYQNGRLAKVEKDTNGDGKIDLWTYYDTTKDGEVVLKEERDLNGDGVVDMWSYYEDGRLVRRDLNAVGLELLSKQDQLPSSQANLKKLPAPGS